eukprot:78502-Rhodomonas_salina.1
MSAGLEVVAGMTVASLRAHVGEHLRSTREADRETRRLLEEEGSTESARRGILGQAPANAFVLNYVASMMGGTIR